MTYLLFRSLYSFFFFILKTRYVHFLLLGFNISLRKFFSLKIIKTIPYIFLIYILYVFASLYNRGIPGGASSKEPPCQCSRYRRLGFDRGSGRSPEGGNGNPLQYSCLEHPMDGGIHGVTEPDTAERLNTSRFCQRYTILGSHTFVRVHWLRVHCGPQSRPVAAAGTQNRRSQGPQDAS